MKRNLEWTKENKGTECESHKNDDSYKFEYTAYDPTTCTGLFCEDKKQENDEENDDHRFRVMCYVSLFLLPHLLEQIVRFSLRVFQILLKKDWE